MMMTMTNNPTPVEGLPPMPNVPDRLYFKIGDVAELAGVKSYVLRFWETEFPVISPQKGNNGQRVYRRSDVETILMIKHLLYNERYSIEGAKKRINELRYQGELKNFKKEVTAPPPPPAESLSPELPKMKEKLHRVQGLVRDLKNLQQVPLNKLFNY